MKKNPKWYNLKSFWPRKETLGPYLGRNNWIMDLSDFTEYQSNNGRNKCKSSSGAEYNSQFNTKDPFYTGLSSIHLDSAHSRLMRGCQMSRSWCWCPDNVWTSESEECLHSARVRAGAGIILRLGLRSTPALAVSRDPFTEELSQATTAASAICQHWCNYYLIWFTRNRKECL